MEDGAQWSDSPSGGHADGGHPHLRCQGHAAPPVQVLLPSSYPSMHWHTHMSQYCCSWRRFVKTGVLTPESLKSVGLYTISASSSLLGQAVLLLHVRILLHSLCFRTVTIALVRNKMREWDGQILVRRTVYFSMQVRDGVKRLPTKPRERYDLFPICIFSHQLVYGGKKKT